MTGSTERRAPVAFGKYRITRRIARGGMAEIYRAWTPKDGWVALKLMRPSLGHDALRAHLFEREARITTQLDHPNVVPVHAYGEEQGRAYLAMEYVRGRDLTHLLKKGRAGGSCPPPALVLWLGKEAAAGLGHAHRLADKSGRPLGIVHRDVSPGNVMLGFDGSVKVLDFGVARMNEATTSLDTQTGTLRGKFAYMSPEQTRGDDIDARSDVFSLGTVLYELLTGTNCFRAPEPIPTLERVQNLRPALPSRAKTGLSKKFDEVLARCLAKEPERRFSDGIELARALSELLSSMGFGGQESARRYMESLFGRDRIEEEVVLIREQEDIEATAEAQVLGSYGSGQDLDAGEVRVSTHEEASRSELESIRPSGSADGEGVFSNQVRVEDETETLAVQNLRLPGESGPEAPGSVKVLSSLLAPAPQTPAASEASRPPGSLRGPGPGKTLRRTFAVVAVAGLFAGAVSAGLRPPPERDDPTRIPPVTIRIPSDAQPVAALPGSGSVSSDPRSRAQRDRGPSQDSKAESPSPDPGAPSIGLRKSRASEAAMPALAPGADSAMAKGPAPAGSSAPKGQARGASESREPAAPGASELKVRARPASSEPKGSARRAAPERKRRAAPGSSEPKGVVSRASAERSRRRLARTRRARRAQASEATGFLNVGARPWARIIINGKLWPHTTPQAGIELSVGTHTIELSNPQTGRRVTREVEISRGVDRTLMVDLRARADRR